jgi:hypothetical protein
MSGGGSSGSGARTVSCALYSQQTGASTSLAASFWSGSYYLKLSASSNTNCSFTFPNGILTTGGSTQVSTTATQNNSSNASTYVATSIAGLRVLAQPVSILLTPGLYWLALAQSSAQSNASYDIGVSHFGIASNSNIGFQNFGVNSSASNAGYWGSNWGMGTYSATSNAFPASIALISDSIRNQASAFVPAFNFSAFTTGTNYL